MSLKRIFKYCLLPLLTACILCPAAARDNSGYRFTAPLAAVSKDGFYRISLSPEIQGRSAAGQQDIRILDSKNVQVPYVFGETAQQSTVTYVFPIVQEDRNAEKEYFITIKNEQRISFDELWLDVKNAAATRSITLSGSDDNQHWYVVRDNFYWEIISGSGQVNGTGKFSFPLINYPFLRITFKDRESLPVKVTRATTHSNRQGSVTYTAVPVPALTQKDSTDKRSYVTARFTLPYQISKIELDLGGPKYFRRTAWFIINDQQADQQAAITLSSATQSAALDARAASLTLVIENDDNPPLKVNSIKAFQEEQYMISYLIAGQSYSLIFGDTTAEAPKYDLAFFKDSIGKEIPLLGTGAIVALEKNSPQITAPPATNNKWLLWLLLGGLLAGLSVITFQMIKKINKQI